MSTFKKIDGETYVNVDQVTTVKVQTKVAFLDSTVIVTVNLLDGKFLQRMFVDATAARIFLVNLTSLREDEL